MKKGSTYIQRKKDKNKKTKIAFHSHFDSHFYYSIV